MNASIKLYKGGKRILEFMEKHTLLLDRLSSGKILIPPCLIYTFNPILMKIPPGISLTNLFLKVTWKNKSTGVKIMSF